MSKDNALSTTSENALALGDDYAAELLTGLVESRTQLVAPGGGKPLLRLLKDGHWVYGQDDAEVEKGSKWAINVKTLGWGSVCWTKYEGQKNKRLGLVCGPMSQPKPPTPAPIEGFPFVDYFTFDALCVSGRDKGTEVTYGTNSVGGTRAMTKLRDALINRLQTPEGPRYPCPVITLEQEDYKGDYGKIFNPIWPIVGWADLGGNLAPTEGKPASSPPASAPAAAKPAKPRKVPEAVATPEEPVSTVQAHAGQRRRHRPA